MGKCILSFDQIEILKKASDPDHSDSHWLFVTWFIKDGAVRTEKIPLINQNGSRVLESGDIILPVSSNVDCEDREPATAAFLVMNLGSYDWNEQIDAAGKIASEFAKIATEYYLKAVKFFLENLAPAPISTFANLVAKHYPEFYSHVALSVGAAIEDVFVPLIKEIVANVLVLLGRPNCNGPVFHGVAVFKPYNFPEQPNPPEMVWKIYTTSSKPGCQSAKTSVHYTVDRQVDSVPQFPTTPLPQYVFVPSVNQSESAWVGSWVEDNFSQPPKIFITIAPSTVASGQFAIAISETVDPRFDVTFQTKADPKAPSNALLLVPFKGENVPGTIQPWSSLPVSPDKFIVFTGKHAAGASGSASTSIPLSTENDPAPPEPLMALSWKRPYSSGTPLTFVRASAHQVFVPGSADTSLFFEVADGFRLEDRDITLAFYTVASSGQVVGYALRYVRGTSSAYTRADWMLVRRNR